MRFVSIRKYCTRLFYIYKPRHMVKTGTCKPYRLSGVAALDYTREQEQNNLMVYCLYRETRKTGIRE